MGRVALVTGGTRGLGLAIAEALAHAGHTPVLLYRSDEESAQAALERLKPVAPNAAAYAGDVDDDARIEAIVAEVAESIGPIGVLVNNAFRSGRPPQKTHTLSVEAWREDVATNLTGQFIVTRACLPHMVDASFGRIVFIGSLAQRGEAGRVAYATVKSALTGFAKTLAQEYARYGITANVVSPGFIEAGAFLRLSEEIRNRALAMVPSRRAGRAEEVAALVVHLASDLGAYVTGQHIGVDGGAR